MELHDKPVNPHVARGQTRRRSAIDDGPHVTPSASNLSMDLPRPRFAISTIKDVIDHYFGKGEGRSATTSIRRGTTPAGEKDIINL
jgi:hypothetical protein